MAIVSRKESAPMLDVEQRRVLRGMAAALAMTALVLGLGTVVVWPFIPALPRLEDRLAFALRCELLTVVWLAAGVAAVARGRFFSAADIQGSGFAMPGPRIAVEAAMLQNTLEQVMLAFAVHLALASLLRGREMVLIPLLVALFCAGRLAFWTGYRSGAGSRAFGFGLTFYPSVLALIMTLVLLLTRT